MASYAVDSSRVVPAFSTRVNLELRKCWAVVELCAVISISFVLKMTMSTWTVFDISLLNIASSFISPRQQKYVTLEIINRYSTKIPRSRTFFSSNVIVSKTTTTVSWTTKLLNRKIVYLFSLTSFFQPLCLSALLSFILVYLLCVTQDNVSHYSCSAGMRLQGNLKPSKSTPTCSCRCFALQASNKIIYYGMPIRTWWETNCSLSAIIPRNFKGNLMQVFCTFSNKIFNYLLWYA